jgi:hypothetical protein
MNLLATLAIAVGFLVRGMTGDIQDAQSLASRYIHALAPGTFAFKNDGSELQREAFRNADLLVVYGSSELEIANPYHASTIFSELRLDRARADHCAGFGPASWARRLAGLGR